MGSFLGQLAEKRDVHVIEVPDPAAVVVGSDDDSSGGTAFSRGDQTLLHEIVKFGIKAASILALPR